MSSAALALFADGKWKKKKVTPAMIKKPDHRFDIGTWPFGGPKIVSGMQATFDVYGSTYDVTLMWQTTRNGVFAVFEDLQYKAFFQENELTSGTTLVYSAEYVNNKFIIHVAKLTPSGDVITDLSTGSTQRIPPSSHSNTATGKRTRLSGDVVIAPAPVNVPALAPTAADAVAAAAAAPAVPASSRKRRAEFDVSTLEGLQEAMYAASAVPQSPAVRRNPPRAVKRSRLSTDELLAGSSASPFAARAMPAELSNGSMAAPARAASYTATVAQAASILLAMSAEQDTASSPARACAATPAAAFAAPSPAGAARSTPPPASSADVDMRDALPVSSPSFQVPNYFTSAAPAGSTGSFQASSPSKRCRF